MKQKIITIFQKKEDGINGIQYAMCYFAIMFVVIMYRFFTCEAGLYVIQQDLQDSLHIVGTAGLAYNYGNNAVYESDLDRLYIVDLAKGTTSSSFNSGEYQQAMKLGNWIVSRYISQLSLVNKKNPTESMMITMCGEHANVLLDTLTIYQPLYQRTVIENPDDANTPFVISYDCKKNDGKYWIVKYDYTIVDNTVTNVSKTLYKIADMNALKLKNGTGTPVGGTTIDMCAKIIVSDEDKVNAILSHLLNADNIKVWEAVDVVPATNDDRAVTR